VNSWRPFCLLVAATACSTGKPAASRPPPPAPNLVTITAIDYALTAPDTIPAGLTTLRMINAGREPHQAVVAGAPGKSFAELQAALLTEGAFPDWVSFPGGDGVVSSGDSAIVTVNLAAGNYLLLCYIASLDGKLHIEKGMYRRLVVVPAPAGTRAAAEPTTDVTVTLSDYAFALSAPLRAGTHTIRIENNGPQLHELTLERLEPGKTLADWKAWMTGGMRGTPPSQPAGGLTGPDKGKVGWLTVTLAPGNYLLNCYVADAKDGKPHFAHGMVREITVS
jgi:uncharacterized cupredoxin-like copper-binding protein